MIGEKAEAMTSVFVNDFCEVQLLKKIADFMAHTAKISIWLKPITNLIKLEMRDLKYKCVEEIKETAAI